MTNQKEVERLSTEVEALRRENAALREDVASLRRNITAFINTHSVQALANEHA